MVWDFMVMVWGLRKVVWFNISQVIYWLRKNLVDPVTLRIAASTLQEDPLSTVYSSYPESFCSLPQSNVTINWFPTNIALYTLLHYAVLFWPSLAHSSQSHEMVWKSCRTSQKMLKSSIGLLIVSTQLSISKRLSNGRTTFGRPAGSS